jgi:hypothetical protein
MNHVKFDNTPEIRKWLQDRNFVGNMNANLTVYGMDVLVQRNDIDGIEFVLKNQISHSLEVKPNHFLIWALKYSSNMETLSYLTMINKKMIYSDKNLLHSIFVYVCSNNNSLEFFSYFLSNFEDIVLGRHHRDKLLEMIFNYDRLDLFKMVENYYDIEGKKDYYWSVGITSFSIQILEHMSRKYSMNNRIDYDVLISIINGYIHGNRMKLIMDMYDSGVIKISNKQLGSLFVHLCRRGNIEDVVEFLEYGVNVQDFIEEAIRHTKNAAILQLLTDG